MKLRSLLLSTLVSAFCVPLLAAQTALGPTAGLPAPTLYGSAAPATVYVCDASHQGTIYKLISGTGAVSSYTCSTVSGTPTWVLDSTTPAQPVGENVVTSSTTPTFNPNVGVNTMTLTGNVTTFTLAAPVNAGTQTCLVFVQNGTLAYTVSAPANVVGLMTLSTLLNKRNVQCFSYSASLALWLATSPGVVGH